MRSLLTLSRGRARIMGVLYAATVAVLGITALAARAADRPLGYLTREPVEAVSRSGELCSGLECSYAGALSNLGILIGCAGAAVCFFAAYLASRGGVARSRVGFLVTGGALTSALVLDDLVMIHENVLPLLIGGGEKLTLAAYLLAGSAFVFAYRDELMRTDVVLLIAAVALFAASVAADKLLDHVHLVEDGAKLLGLVSWTAYFVFTALDLLARRHEQSAA
jgi:hypothetical protein